MMVGQIDWNFIFGTMGLHLLALVTPGPDFILTIKNTLRFGRLRGTVTALGISFGIATHLLYNLFWIDYVLRQWPAVFTYIKYLGVFYLIWLGLSSLWHNKTDKPLTINTELEYKPLKQCFLAGFLTNILNPKAGLFIFSLFTSIASSESKSSSFIISGIGMTLVTATWFCIVSVIFSNFSVRQVYLRLQNFLNNLFGLFFLLAGMVILFGN
jgi:threonine/homoserine/homoserine lactone efflux protein